MADADVLDLVRLDVGGRPVQVLDLNDLSTFNVAMDSFQVAPGAKQPVLSESQRRYGGARQVGESHGNGQVGWTILVKADTADGAISALSTALTQFERTPGELFLRWIPARATHTTLFELRSTARWGMAYRAPQFFGARSFAVPVAWDTDPLARGLRMDVYDDFSVDTRDDYTYDSGTRNEETITGGVLRGAGTLTTERRAIHTERGYLYVDSMQQGKATPNTTINGFKYGRVIKRLDSRNYVEAYVDDNGTNSRLRIDKVVAGSRTNLATNNLSARISSGTSFWLRTTILANAITADYFTAAPGPLTTATRTTSHTLTSGDATQFGTGVEGGYGRAWIPMHASAAVDEESMTGHFSGSLTLPQTVQWATPIPGDAPALADVTVTTSGGTSPPIWALLGWWQRPGSGLAQAPIGLIEAETAGDLSGWSVASDSALRGGRDIVDSTASSSETYTASWTVDPSLLSADEFEREVAVEVWARVLIDTLLVSPTLTLSTRPVDGPNFGASRYTEEWGATGKVLGTPSVVTWRWCRLGTLRFAVDRLRPRQWKIWLAGAVGAGSSGYFGVDYLGLAPARQRACSPSGVPNDASYPDFVVSTSQTSKTIRSDLSAATCSPPNWGHPDHGLGGQLLEPPPGQVDLMCKLSAMVPDDPTVDSATDQLGHTGTLEMAVTPRWHLLRSA